MMSTTIAGINFKNPVLVSSGTFGFGLEYMEYFDPSLLGGIVTKGITAEKRKGNTSPRIHETPAGMLNSIGLENPGVEEFIKTYLPQMKENFSTNIIVNIAGSTVEEYRRVASSLEKAACIAALEVNISCPNVKKGGMTFGAYPQSAAEVVKNIREETALPLIIKLAPNVTAITEIAEAVVEAGADALSLINTVPGMAVDIEKQKPVLGNVIGGLSGPAVKPAALRAVWLVSQKVNVPLIGMGGITCAEDALEFLLAGANAVSIGTGNFVNPSAALEVSKGIEDYLKRKEIGSVQEIVGGAWKGD